MPRVVARRDLVDDVVAGLGPVVVALHDLELEEPHEQRDERQDGEQHHPVVAAPELADVRALDEEAHRRPPSGRGTVIVAWWRRSARRKTRGETSAVAMACGSTSERSARGLCGVAAEDGHQHEDDDALDEREAEGERELREHRLRGEPHAGGAREDEDRHRDEREEPDRRAREEIEQ